MPVRRGSERVWRTRGSHGLSPRLRNPLSLSGARAVVAEASAQPGQPPTAIPDARTPDECGIVVRGSPTA
jgi:hypothetical protein